MLGQLAVLAFRTVPDGEAISVPSFPRWKNISLAKLPLQYKVGDEAHNRLLFKRRMKTGKTWMGYLPGVFNDELISKMFLEIDPSTAQTTIRKYQNARLRMSAAESFTLKEFVGMSDMSYIKFNRAMFFLVVPGSLLLSAMFERSNLMQKKILHKHGKSCGGHE